MVNDISRLSPSQGGCCPRGDRQNEQPYPIDSRHCSSLTVCTPEASSLTSDQVHRSNGPEAFFNRIRQLPLQPRFCAIEELAFVRQGRQWWHLQGRGHGRERNSNIRRLVTTHATLGLARTCIVPEQLVSHHLPIAVENLELQQPVAGHFDIN